MSTPLFSILLPTKNRAGILPYAFRSLLDQTFRDFEVILIDNDDTTNTIEMFYRGLAALIDPRFRYFRTGGLPMADNWEAGVPLARGEFVYVMEDKAVLHPRALELLAQAIEFHSPRCVVFDQKLHMMPPLCSAGDAAAAVAVPFADLPAGRPAVRQLSSTRIIDMFLEQGWAPLQRYAPLCINSVCERTLIRQIQETTGGGRFFLSFAPDLTSALLQLDLVESVARIDLDLVSYAVHETMSNGNRFRSRLKYGFEVMFASGHHENIAHFQRMPLGYLALVHNHVYAEFINMRDRARGRLRGKRLSLDRYFDRIEEDLLELEKLGDSLAPVRTYVRATRARLGSGEL